MKKKFDYLSFIKHLTDFSPRQLKGERKTADFLIFFLKNHKIKYWLDYFFTQVPKIKKAILKADGEKIPCQGCSFVGGKIKDKDYLLSSLIPSRFFLDKSNINFNPKSSAISLSNFYFAPALAISKKDLPSILEAKKIEGAVKVKPIKYQTCHILVGQRKNPKAICFAHYDSLLKGAIDNASGVTIMMSVILNQPELLEKNLFVFSANEELSYNKPIYWGHGFRVFERKYKNLMEKAEGLIVLDCLGYSQTKIYQDDNSIYLAFPIKNRLKWQEKIFVLAGEIDQLMSVYHSQIDDGRGLKLRYLKKAEKKFLNLLC